ncbi:MAG: hydrogenase maturation nickel metallochaperone HypA [Polyangiaceae bacterium]|nr:hydrogenase maturation nickel metallochaperone HypA [Myxococcales bacterium]MCB9584757.1 hydrogenase maturation nickel metallochaperone HypA [Polyangiaceae bacterium]MCB9607670.1 hydrogenase maturation nickel metallochaperone HypA [Polyangiaceae bacterium]
MHEASLSKALLEAVLKSAAEAGAKRVRHVRGFVAETETLNAESLKLHFVALAQGTAAEAAALDLSVTHVRARCEQCATVYLPEAHVLMCPRCDSTNASLLDQVGVGVTSIDIDDDSSASEPTRSPG